jgi:cytoskeletal protein CcmA (bactofilin family)
MWNKKNPDTAKSVALESKDVLLSKKTTDALPPLAATDLATGWLGSSLRVKGDISGAEDLLIDGAVEGMIQLDEHKVTVGTTAKLKADINARDVVVYGYVKGNVHATGRIEIKRNGAVIGNLTTAQIMIEDGADFKGSIEIDRGPTKEVDKNVFKRAAAASAGSAPKSL